MEKILSLVLGTLVLCFLFSFLFEFEFRSVWILSQGQRAPLERCMSGVDMVNPINWITKNLIARNHIEWSCSAEMTIGECEEDMSNASQQ